MPEQLEIIGEVEERTIGEILLRIAPIEPPPHPLGPAAAEPHWGIFATAPCYHPQQWEAGWLVLFTDTHPEESIELLDEEAIERTERLSILVGVSFRAVLASVIGVMRSQEAAIGRLPPLAWESPLEQLANVRSYITEADPTRVATLLSMMAHWTSDPGGTNGARFLT